MRIVLLVAACTLCLAFAAHGAEPASQADASAQLPATPLSVAPTEPQEQDGCSHAHALVAKTAYTPDDDANGGGDDAACCVRSSTCAQFLSTQALLKPPARART